MLHPPARYSLPIMAGVMLSLAACGPNEEELKALMVQQIEEEKQKEENATKAAQQALIDSRTPVEQTLNFLAELEVLMEGYRPVLPTLNDNTDLLKCVTDYQFSTNKELKTRSKSLKKQKQKSQKERDKVYDEFQAKRYLQYRIDYNWKSRVATEAKYACRYPGFMDYGDWYPGEWDWDSSKSECTEGGIWKVYKASDTHGNTDYTEEGQGLYSRTQTPAPPELMKRLEASGLEVPQFLFCRVEEITAAAYACWYSDGDGWEWGENATDCQDYGGQWKAHKQEKVLCSSQGTALEIHPQGIDWVSAGSINRGDVLSVPLKEGQNEPNGVLGMNKEMAWVLNATSDSIAIMTPAECPSMETILGSK